MSDAIKGVLTVLLWTVLPTAVVAIILAVTGHFSDWIWLLIGTGVFGLLYGLESGILTIYDLGSGVGWVELLVDMSWSLPNTVFGFVFGNPIYIWFGTPSRADSANAGWIVFRPRSSTGFGNHVLQTLGTINLGGSGQHEKMHLLQARIFGPLYLPLFAACYAVTFTLQLVWTLTGGGILWLLRMRQKPYFEPPGHSAVGGFFGWIYFATPFELWAYGAGNP